MLEDVARLLWTSYQILSASLMILQQNDRYVVITKGRRGLTGADRQPQGRPQPLSGSALLTVRHPVEKLFTLHLKAFASIVSPSKLLLTLDIAHTILRPILSGL